MCITDKVCYFGTDSCLVALQLIRSGVPKRKRVRIKTRVLTAGQQEGMGGDGGRGGSYRKASLFGVSLLFTLRLARLGACRHSSGEWTERRMWPFRWRTREPVSGPPNWFSPVEFAQAWPHPARDGRLEVVKLHLIWDYTVRLFGRMFEPDDSF